MNDHYNIIIAITLINSGKAIQNVLFGMMSVPVAWNLNFMMIAPTTKYATIAPKNLRIINYTTNVN